MGEREGESRKTAYYFDDKLSFLLSREGRHAYNEKNTEQVQLGRGPCSEPQKGTQRKIYTPNRSVELSQGVEA